MYAKHMLALPRYKIGYLDSLLGVSCTICINLTFSVEFKKKLTCMSLASKVVFENKSVATAFKTNRWAPQPKRVALHLSQIAMQI
jgi:hypothetical protein